LTAVPCWLGVRDAQRPLLQYPSLLSGQMTVNRICAVARVPVSRAAPAAVVTVTVQVYVLLGHRPLTVSVIGAVVQAACAAPAPVICSRHVAVPPLLLGVSVTRTPL
jgi:hypothetical protein